MHKKPLNKDEEEERREQADTYEEEEDGQEIYNSMQRPPMLSGRPQTLQQLLTNMNSVASWPALAIGAIRRRIRTTSHANAEAARRSQIQTHLSNSQQSKVPGPIPKIGDHWLPRASSRNGAPQFYFLNRAVGAYCQVQSQNAPLFHGPQRLEVNYAWYSQQPSISQTTPLTNRRRLTQHPWYQVRGPSNAGIFNSQQTLNFGAVGANPQWLPSRIVHAASTGGVVHYLSLSRLAEGYSSRVQSEDQPMFRGPRPREGNFPTTQQPLTKKHSEQPPAAATQVPVPDPGFNYASSASTLTRNEPTLRYQRYYCVLCEYHGVYYTSSFSWPCNTFHRYGHKMKCYARDVFEDKVIFAPKNAALNNELAYCTNCQKVLFKHRAKPGNHDCDQRGESQPIKYMPTIDEGEGDDYCLMCQLRCGNVEEHHKIVHNGNTVYKVGKMFDKKCLAPLHLHEEDHRDELIEDSADNGKRRFAYEYRARRITSF